MFYYGPGKLALGLDKDGSPEISFLQMRYMGTSVTGDKGEFRTRSILSFGVEMAGITAKDLASVRTRLRGEGVRISFLNPLPIRRVEAVLNYTPLIESETPAPPKTDGENDALPIGSAASESVEGAKPGAGYWSERVFTIAPDDATSQALWDAFNTGKVMLSLSYAFYSDGVPPEEEKPKVEGNVQIPDEPDQSAETEEKKQDPRLVLADTIAVTVDASKYPDRFKQIDINEGVPANYAALSVYCYDFNNSLRPDLHMKVVEIQATSVTGKPLAKEVVFSKSSPDVYSATVRFQFAVSLKHPYRYRIREITTAGEEKVKPWQDGKPWAQMLDVTTPPEEQPHTHEDIDTEDEGDKP